MKKKINIYMPPRYFIFFGIAIALFSLLTKGTIEPFSVLSFFSMGIFEIIFKKQKKIPSNILSFTCGLILVLLLKLYVIDFVVMKNDILELGIKKEDRLFYQPSFFKLQKGDWVLYQSEDKEPKQYFAIIRKVENNSCTIFIPTMRELKKIDKSQIKGEIIFPSQSKGAFKRWTYLPI